MLTLVVGIGSHHWFELRGENGLVVLAVHDDGPGVDPELGERVSSNRE